MSAYHNTYWYPVDFFDGELHREEQCWILGWFWSDGNVAKTYHTCSVTVHSDDVDVLQKIKAAMRIDKPNDKHPQKQAFCFRINSVRICKRLAELGCIPNKSLVVEYPPCLTTIDQHRAFLRGMFEGDGSIYSRNKHSICSIGCQISSGSAQFLYALRDKMKELLDIDCPIYLKKGEPRIIAIGHGHQDVYRFMSFIYDTSRLDLVMDRKYQKWQEFKNRVDNPRPKRFNLNLTTRRAFHIKAPDNQIYHSDTMSGFAREFGLKVGSLNALIKGRTGSLHGWTIPTQPELSTHLGTKIIEKVYV